MSLSSSNSRSMLLLASLSVSFSLLFLTLVAPALASAPQCPSGWKAYQKCTTCKGSNPAGCVCDTYGQCVPYCGYVEGLSVPYPTVVGRACATCRGPKTTDGCICNADMSNSPLLSSSCLPFCNQATLGLQCKSCKSSSGAGCACGKKGGSFACVDSCDASAAFVQRNCTKCGGGSCSCSPSSGGKCVSYCSDPANKVRGCAASGGSGGSNPSVGVTHGNYNPKSQNFCSYAANGVACKTCKGASCVCLYGKCVPDTFCKSKAFGTNCFSCEVASPGVKNSQGILQSSYIATPGCYCSGLGSCVSGCVYAQNNGAKCGGSYCVSKDGSQCTCYLGRCRTDLCGIKAFQGQVCAPGKKCKGNQCVKG